MPETAPRQKGWVELIATALAVSSLVGASFEVVTGAIERADSYHTNNPYLAAQERHDSTADFVHGLFFLGGAAVTGGIAVGRRGARLKDD